MTSENLRSGTEHSGTEPSHCLCLRQGCLLVTVPPVGAREPGASVPADLSARNLLKWILILLLGILCCLKLPQYWPVHAHVHWYLVQVQRILCNSLDVMCARQVVQRCRFSPSLRIVCWLLGCVELERMSFEDVLELFLSPQTTTGSLCRV